MFAVSLILRHLKKAFSHPPLILVGLLLCPFSLVAQDSEPESATRLQELRFGQVLYEYFQNKPLASLEAAELAAFYGYPIEQKGRMQLIQGGASLQLGLTRSATEQLSQLLAQTQPPDIQAQAWYWLAKTAFQQGMYAVSAQASAKLQQPGLLDFIEPQQFQEMAYQHAFYQLQQRPEDWQNILSGVDSSTEWYPYLVANAAIQAFNNAQFDMSARLFVDAIKALQAPETAEWEWSFDWLSWFDPREWFWDQEQTVTPVNVKAREQNALLDRLYLSLGRAFVQQQNYNAAFNAFKQVQSDSLYAEQGLLAYGWALAKDERWSEAMPVWQHLHRQGTGLASLQATHALAYGFERLSDYRRAFNMLGESLSQLNAARDELKTLQAQILQPRFFVRLASEQSAIKQVWPARHHDMLVDILSGDNQADTANQLTSMLQLNDAAKMIRHKLLTLKHMQQLLVERKAALLARADDLQLEQARTTLDQARAQLTQLTAKVEQAQQYPEHFASAEQRSQLVRLTAIERRLQKLKTSDSGISTQRVEQLQQRYEILQGVLQWQLAEQQISQQYAHESAIAKTTAAFKQAEQQFFDLQQVNLEQQGLAPHWQEQTMQIATLRQRYAQQSQRTDAILSRLSERLAQYVQQQIRYRDAILLEQITATQLAMLRMQDRQRVSPLVGAGGQE